jgi:hypothetical protein
MFFFPIDSFRLHPQEAKIFLFCNFLNSVAGIFTLLPQVQRIHHRDFFPSLPA